MSNDSSGRIVAELSDWISRAEPGARLPSTRELVARHEASPVTVQKALRALVAQGLVESRPGVGTFVRARRATRVHDHRWQTSALGAVPRVPEPSTALRPAPEGAIALHSGYPDRELLPERLVRAAFARAARGGAALERPTAAGDAELRAWFAASLAGSTLHGIDPPTPEDVVVVPGSQSGISTLFRALAGPGGALVMESPTYWGAIRAAAWAGVRVVPVAGGEHGPDPDEVDRALARSGARAFYAQPLFANPTGACWSVETAERILEVVRRHGVFLIEDDWAHDFGIEDDPVPLAARDDDGHVIHLRSLTKSVSPAVRVAAVIARGPVRERVLVSAQSESMYVSGALQEVALDVVTRPAWRTHRQGLRHRLAERRDLLTSALAEHAPALRVESPPRGGLNLWARLPEGVSPLRAAEECARAGVVVAPGDEWFPTEPTGPYLRLNYSGPRPGDFVEGARVIGRVVEGLVG
ncbi:PLP-dependent aminotransferase family protein [Nocardiopsis alba]|jgi:DNA-binding transcriptional MocR family regulator|uniref:aminotransferase-like domain-containing protein n=1 Tax=Nocardiopsis alba TaxID=53437 RepID=UPI00366B366C